MEIVEREMSIFEGLNGFSRNSSHPKCQLLEDIQLKDVHQQLINNILLTKFGFS